MKCQLCGDKDAIRYAVLPGGFELAAPGDRRTKAMGMIFLFGVLRKRARVDALNLCLPCVERVDATTQFWRDAGFEEGEEAQVARMLHADSMGASEGELSRMVEDYGAGLPVVMPGEEVAIGRKSEGGGKVVYLPNAEPRRRVRPGRRGAA